MTNILSYIYRDYLDKAAAFNHDKLVKVIKRTPRLMDNRHDARVLESAIHRGLPYQMRGIAMQTRGVPYQEIASFDRAAKIRTGSARFLAAYHEARRTR